MSAVPVDAAEYTPKKVAADRAYLMRHCAFKGVQMMSLLTPAILLPLAIYRRSFSPTLFLRRYGITSMVVGPIFGYAAGEGRMRSLPVTEQQVGAVDRAERLRWNRGQVRVDDYTAIGGVLGALGTTAIFLRRVPLPWTLLGGSALGVAAGIGVHVSQNFKDGTGEGVGRMVEEAKGAISGP